MEKVFFSNFLNCYNFPTLAPDPQHCPPARKNECSFLFTIFCSSYILFLQNYSISQKIVHTHGKVQM